MGVDVSVTFVSGLLTVADLVATETVRSAAARTLFFVIGAPTRQSAGLSFFSAWGDGGLDLKSLAKELSVNRGKVCVVWKSESGGVGGYESFSDGQVLETAATADRYWLLPTQGVEKTYGQPLKIRQRDHVCFPEFLIDDRLVCYRIVGEGGHFEIEPQPPGCPLQLLDHSMGVEPIFPFESLDR